jgi:cytochrome P450
VPDTSTPSLWHEVQRILTADAEAIQDPYPVFNRLRTEAPLFRYDTYTMIISRHADVKAAYRDDDLFPTTPALGGRFEGMLRLLDPDELAMMDEFAAFDQHTISRKNGDDHSRVRGAASRYLTPGRVRGLEPTFQEIFDELIADQADQDVVDFMPVAYRLPLLVITEILGVPRQDAEQVKQWGDAWTISRNPIQPRDVRNKRRVMDEYRGYVRALIDLHRLSEIKSDLVASMLDASERDRVTEDELVAFFLHTLFAGHETTQHLIGNGLRALLLHREQWQMLCDDPALVPSAVEECLRYDGPVPFITKRSAAGAHLGDEAIPAGLDMMLGAAAANRDPEVFTDPDRFDILRQPNDHMMLGFGRHFCIGASLARLEGRIVFTTLTRQYPDLNFATDPSTLRYHGGIRGLNELPIRLGKRRD